MHHQLYVYSKRFVFKFILRSNLFDAYLLTPEFFFNQHLMQKNQTLRSGKGTLNVKEETNVK